MDQDKIFSIRPKFVPKIVGLQVVGIGISGAFMFAGVVEILILVVSSIWGLGIDTGFLFMLLFLLGLICIPTFLYEVRRKNHNQTRFDFYDDYVDFSYYTGSFMRRKQGRLYYSDIIDVVQYSNFYQNFVGLKTVQLHAHNHSLYEPSQKFIGIQIEDVRTGKGVGGKIMNLLDRRHHAVELERQAAVPEYNPDVPALEIRAENAAPAAEVMEDGVKG